MVVADFFRDALTCGDSGRLFGVFSGGVPWPVAGLGVLLPEKNVADRFLK